MKFPEKTSELKALAAQIVLETKAKAKSGPSEFVPEAFKNYDELLRESHLHILPPNEIGCKEGCSYCCSGTHHPCTSSEAAVIYKFVKQHLEEEELEAKRTKVRWAVHHAIEQPDARGYRCPFLGDDQRCEIYEVRPIVCRGQHSLSVDACKRGYGDGDGNVEIPIVHADREIGLAYLQGLTKAEKAAGQEGSLDLLQNHLVKMFDEN